MNAEGAVGDVYGLSSVGHVCGMGIVIDVCGDIGVLCGIDGMCGADALVV